MTGSNDPRVLGELYGMSLSDQLPYLGGHLHLRLLEEILKEEPRYLNAIPNRKAFERFEAGNDMMQAYCWWTLLGQNIGLKHLMVGDVDPAIGRRYTSQLAWLNPTSPLEQWYESWSEVLENAMEKDSWCQEEVFELAMTLGVAQKYAFHKAGYCSMGCENPGVVDREADDLLGTCIGDPLRVRNWLNERSDRVLEILKKYDVSTT